MPVQVEFRLRTRRGPVQVSFIITDDDPMPGDDVDTGSQAPATTSTGANVLNRLLPKGSTALPQFSGDPDTRAQAAPFLLMVKRVFELSPELTNVHKLTALQSCFPINSPANAWFLQKLPELHTFAAFEAAFTERFGSSEIDLQLLRREFRDFAQEDSQSVTQFHMALSALATRISLSGAPLDNQYIAEQFRWGLKPNISAELFREQLRTKRILLTSWSSSLRILSVRKYHAPVVDQVLANRTCVHSMAADMAGLTQASGVCIIRRIRMIQMIAEQCSV